MRVIDAAIWNPWWKHGKEFVYFDADMRRVKESFVEFKRKIIEPKAGKIFVIRGIRRSGKTVYLKQIIEYLLAKGVNPHHIFYLKCDSINSIRELSSTLLSYFSMYPDAKLLYIFLDEITYLDEWERILKELSDLPERYRISVFATGSNPVRIKTEEILREWVVEYYFKPLTFNEFAIQVIDKVSAFVEEEEFRLSLRKLKETLKSRKLISLEESNEKILENARAISHFLREIEFLLDIYILTGGFPAVINDYLRKRFQEKKEYIDDSLFDEQIRRTLDDVRKIIRKTEALEPILRLIAEKYTQRDTFNKMARLLGISVPTFSEILRLFEESCSINILYPYDVANKRMMEKGEKKIYFADPFIYHAVLKYLKGIPFDEIKRIAFDEKEKLLEGCLCSHLAQIKEIPYVKRWKTYLWFAYSHVTKREIDFVFESDKTEEFIGIELKYQERINSREITRMSGIERYILVSKFDLGLTKFYLTIPAAVFLILLKKSERDV
jgi:predicted AAA+ superfamily ATPase